MIEFHYTVATWRVALAAFLAVALVGPGFAWALNGRFRWLDQKSLGAVVGVALNLILLLLFLPAGVVLCIFAVFFLTGIWELGRTEYNRSVRQPAATESAKQALAAQARAALHEAELSVTPNGLTSTPNRRGQS